MGSEKFLPEIYVCSIGELLAGELKNKGSQEEKTLKIEKLKIPDYQRPYEWEREHVEAFLEDLLSAYEQSNNQKVYLIGNMIFYKNLENDTPTYEIVDGQQRLITLGLILHFLKNRNGNRENCQDIEKLLNLTLSHQSVKKILENYEIIKNRINNIFPDSEKKEKFFEFLKKNIIVNITITEDLDQAFFLFDAQNTRGKPLERKDLLKVHHLRLIEDTDKRKFWAKEWEKYERVKDEKTSEERDLLKEVLELVAIARKGIRKELLPEDLLEVDVYKEFLSEEDNEHELNNYNQPPIFKEFKYDPESDNLSLITKVLTLKFPKYVIEKGWKFLPFEINQSIVGGERFFYFVKKYFNLVKELEEKHGELFNLFANFRGKGNMYINAIYQPVLLFFYDKFGDKMFKEFALRLVIIFSYYRLNSQSIRKEGILKYQWSGGSPLDLFNLILLKYSPNLVIKQLDKYIQYEVGDEVKDGKINIFSDEIKIGDKEVGYEKGNFIKNWKGKFGKEIQEILRKLGRNWE